MAVQPINDRTTRWVPIYMLKEDMGEMRLVVTIDVQGKLGSWTMLQVLRGKIREVYVLSE